MFADTNEGCQLGYKRVVGETGFDTVDVESLRTFDALIAWQMEAVESVEVMPDPSAENKSFIKISVGG
jgi:hypothetical protein